MSDEMERDYFARREAQEREAAVLAADSAVRDAHFVMAERYADRASMLEEQHFDDSAVAARCLRYVDPT